MGPSLGDPKLDIKNSGFEAPGPLWGPWGPKYKSLYLKVPPRFDYSLVSTIPLNTVGLQVFKKRLRRYRSADPGLENFVSSE